MTFPISGLIFMGICAVGAGFMLAWLVLEAKLSLENSRELSAEKARLKAEYIRREDSIKNSCHMEILQLKRDYTRSLATIMKVLKSHGIEVSASDQTLEIHNTSDDWLYS